MSTYRTPAASRYGLPAWAPWNGPWAFNRGYYTGYSTWRQPLPDGRHASGGASLLDTGGHVAGFIYFQKLPQGTERIRFGARMIDAETEQTASSLDIPSVVTE